LTVFRLSLAPAAGAAAAEGPLAVRPLAAGDTWTQFGPMPTPRHSLVAATVGSRIYLPGGSTQQGTLGPATTLLLDAFDPSQ
jgi:hypothetical protein